MHSSSSCASPTESPESASCPAESPLAESAPSPSIGAADSSPPPSPSPTKSSPDLSVVEQETEDSLSPSNCSEDGEHIDTQSDVHETTADEQHPTSSAEHSPSVECSADASAQESDARGETFEPPDDHTSSECAASSSSGPCPEGADKCAKRKFKKDSEHSAASAAQVTGEKFEAQAFGTLEEHVQSHDYPAHVATCGACKFWKNRWAWSDTFSYCHPVSGKKETWLAFKNGFAVCLICASHSKQAASAKSKYASGQGNLLRKDSILQHGRSGEHTAAHQAMMQRLRATDSRGPPGTVAIFDGLEPAESARAESARAEKPTAHRVVTRTPLTTTGCRAVIAARAMLETSSSFDSIDVWLGALTSGDREALESSWHTKRLVMAMAQYERIQTHRLLKEGAVFRLAADGQERTYQVEIGTVLWSFPASLQQFCRHGQQDGWLQELGPRGPWVVERIIGMREFPQDMNSDGKVAMIEDCVRRACQSPGGHIDVKLHQHVCAQTRAWCSDGADLGVATAASASFPGLKFHAWDESHSAQRMCSNAMVDDDEITTTDKLLVTGKKPYSLAKFLSTSMVFRKKMGDAQLADEVSFVKKKGGPPSGSTAGQDRTRARVGVGKASLTLSPPRLDQPIVRGAYSPGCICRSLAERTVRVSSWEVSWPISVPNIILGSRRVMKGIQTRPRSRRGRKHSSRGCGPCSTTL